LSNRLNSEGDMSIVVGPKKSWTELNAITDQTQPEPGVPGQAQQTPDNALTFHYHLDGSWDNAKWAETHDNPDPNNPFFDPDGKKNNDALKQAINDAFKKYKKIDLTDPNGPQWLLAYRMYPNKDHPRWQAQECCGCCCGCFAPRDWQPPEV
jgi:hypothetical protein